MYELEARLRDLIDERADWAVILRNVSGDADGYDTGYDTLRGGYEEHVDAISTSGPSTTRRSGSSRR